MYSSLILCYAGQGKVVCSLDVDHSGSRLLAGSRDYSLRMFDFNGMKSDMRSFRKIEPSDGHPVHAVSLSPTGLPSRLSPVLSSYRILNCKPSNCVLSVSASQICLTLCKLLSTHHVLQSACFCLQPQMPPVHCASS